MGRVTEAAALRRLEIPHGQQQYQIVLLAPHQDVGDEVTSCGPWTTSGHLVLKRHLSQGQNETVS